MNYYNEYDQRAAAWLRELIRSGQIPAGDVDERSITEIKANELKGYTQHHFFAGIGGWSLALRLAGWPEDRPVRTGSCPCQPFSSAGRQLGTADARHLWPVFRDLIKQLEPATTFGEQVASSLGREWLAGVRADLEGMGYEVGASDLCAASVGSPHIRQRLFWVAHPNLSIRDEWPRSGEQSLRHKNEMACGMGESESVRRIGRKDEQNQRRGQLASGYSSAWSAARIINCADGKARRIEPSSFPLAHGIPCRVGRLRGYGNAIVPQVAAQFIQAYLEATCPTLKQS